MSYQQLTLDERYQIHVLLRMKTSRAQIAQRLGRHRSTVSRELRRNSDPALVAQYTARGANRRARRRRIAKSAASRKIQGALQALVEQKLRLGWSPEQISGRLLLERGIHLSHETIYQHVLRDAKKLGILRYCLRFSGAKQHRLRKSRRGDRTKMRKNWIDQRPAAANDRTELGHWERDCLLGTQGQAALLTMIDRRSRLTLIRHVSKVNTKRVAAATTAALKPHRKLTKTLTNDNGGEFQRDQALQEELRIPIFFTDPGAPWQRGSIENANGLIRQYVPKGTSLDRVRSWLPKALEDTLNFRPRKILGFRTPHEVFFDHHVRLTSEPLMRLGLEFSTGTWNGQ
jgi:IS30 family transposase